jgi:hemolysin activation/secretion protein
LRLQSWAPLLWAAVGLFFLNSVHAAAPGQERPLITLLLPDIRIEGISEYPEHGITSQAIHGDVLAVLVAHKQRISMACLQDMTSRITGRYRAAGFVFTRAYIPAQRASDGVIVIRLLEGWLSDVDVYDNRDYGSDVLVAPFTSLKGKVLYSPQVEEALALVNDMPGVDAFGFFSIGDEVGSTRINLRIKREQQWAAALRTDNHGSPLTGELRALANAEWFNPAGKADVLKLGVLHSFEPENASFGYLQYQLPAGDAWSRVGFEMAADQYDLGQRGSETYDEFRISGKSQSVRTHYRRLLRKSGGEEIAWQLDARISDSETASATYPDVFDDEQRDWALGWQWQQNASNRKSGFWWQWNAGLHVGRYVDGLPVGQSSQYYLTNAYVALGGQLPWIDSARGHHWYAEIDAQYSDDILPATQQYSLTGATRARGFEPGVFVGDTGSSMRIAWQPPIQFVLPWWADRKWLADFSPQLFAEYGYAVQRLPTASSDDWGRVADIGVGLDYQLGDAITVNTSIAKAVDHRVSFSDGNISTCRAYVAATWHFD